jgi:hypothetical protein
MSNGFSALGTGHPNLILESDYAKQPDAKRWGFRVETRVDIHKNDIQQVKDWLDIGDAQSMEALMNFLIAEVPGMDPVGQQNARKMIAAAFGKVFPLSETAQRHVGDVPVDRQSRDIDSRR